jgi:hypothetical protein
MPFPVRGRAIAYENEQLPRLQTSPRLRGEVTIGARFHTRPAASGARLGTQRDRTTHMTTLMESLDYAASVRDPA